ncbi:MAG: hypothetical protein ACKO8I_17860 [Cyanobacteriota bacterium]
MLEKLARHPEALAALTGEQQGVPAPPALGLPLQKAGCGMARHQSLELLPEPAAIGCQTHGSQAEMTATAVGTGSQVAQLKLSRVAEQLEMGLSQLAQGLGSAC